MSDIEFDKFLPDDLRAVSREYWTPLRVVKRAAEWFDDLQIRTVVDIGSGAGKFCVAGALAGRASFIGLEQRASLVESGRALADAFRVAYRVTFVHGAVADLMIPQADAYYLFNPFGECRFDSVRDDADLQVAFTVSQQLQDIAIIEDFIDCAPMGTWILTYNGFGGRIPQCYDLVRIEWTLPSALRLWRKHRE